MTSREPEREPLDAAGRPDADEVAAAAVEDEPLRAPAPLPLASILAWQALACGALVAATVASGRGEALGVASGAAVMTASMVFTRQALGFALRHHARPLLGLGFFFLKLGLVLAVIAAGFYTEWIAPMSFAAGATTLPVAIVMDACYPIRRPLAHPASLPKTKE